MLRTRRAKASHISCGWLTPLVRSTKHIEKYYVNGFNLLMKNT